MEIYKSDRGLLMEIESWLSFNRAPEAKDLADLKAGILHHLQATKGESSSWATQARQLIAETEAETTLPLATKFLADEAVGLVGELGDMLDKCAQWFAKHERTAVLPGGGDTAINRIGEVLIKAATFTAAIAPATPTVGGEAETQIFPPVDAVPEYVPDWPSIPEKFSHVAVDKDGWVFGYISHPRPKENHENWCPAEGRDGFLYLGEIPPPPGDTWKKMLYKRPE